jgi:hypothetical protein
MLCIFCLEERPPSLEHVFSLAIGGTVKIDRVCSQCNSALGSRVDAALSDFLPIRTRRAKLGLAGHGREPPGQFEILLGDQKLIGPTANRIRTTLNKATGKLDIRQLHHATDVILPDGRKVRQVTIDARDKDQIPKIIQRERKRHGLPPLSEEELAVEAKKFTVNTVENPLVQVRFNVSFAYLRHAMMKIAYELAFLWLGESYLDDALAIELREAICKEDLASTDKLAGYVGEAEPCAVFKFWTPHEAHHLAFASVVANSLVVAVRVFDLYAAAIVVSREPNRYVRSAADSSKLRFLAIDSVSGKTINTTYDAESRRVATAMTTYRRLPPFPDPLSPPPDEPSEGPS